MGALGSQSKDNGGEGEEEEVEKECKDGGTYPRIRWEVLKEEEKMEEYKEKTNEKIVQCGPRERDCKNEWEVLAGVMTEAAKEVCGETGKAVANPWTIGHEEALNEMKRGIKEAVKTRVNAI